MNGYEGAFFIMSTLRKKYLGDRGFYRYVLGIVVPIMIQNGITNFVSLLDNIMIGRLGTLQMSSVSIANQFVFIFNLCVFGAVAGAGIFTAQFHGNNDQQGIRYTFRFKVAICVILVAVASTVFLLFGDKLINLYLLSAGNKPEENAASLNYGVRYLRVMILGLLPFALCNSYAGTLRETEQTRVPMTAGIVAVFLNLVLNYILIYGHFGAPKMGVEGAALATVISRYVELLIVALWVHTHSERNGYIKGVYSSLYIPGSLLKQIIIKGTPLLANEAMWSSGMALLTQCYSQRGLSVVAAMNINSTIYHLCSVMYMSMGNAVGIIMGRLLGAGRSREEVVDTNRKLIALSVLSCLVCGGILILLSGVFPKIYNTTDEIRHMATILICINGCFMGIHAYTNAAYFTLRSGGKTIVTFLFDSCFIWVCNVPLAYFLSVKTSMPIVPMYALCSSMDILKVIVGAVMIKQGKWIQNLVKQ